MTFTLSAQKTIKQKEGIRMKAIIFDLDGVLVHTDRYHYQAWKELADSLGLAFDERKNNRLRGVSRMESLEIVLQESAKSYSEKEKQEFAESKNETYRKLLERMTPEDVEPKVRDTLKELRDRGYLLAIGSSSKNAGLILDKTDLRKYFDAISDGNHIKRSKPDPEVFLRAAVLLNLMPQDCWVIEDAEAGIAAAKAAGMRAIGVGDAFGRPGTDYSAECFSDILKAIE